MDVFMFNHNHCSQAKREEAYPVMVFFYGGGFEVGAAYGYTAEYFLDEDVVFVVVQYRLGLFGKLSYQYRTFLT